MDTLSCVVLIIFGLLVYGGWFLLHKMNMLPKIDFKHPSGYILYDAFFAVFGTVVILAGILALFV